MKKSLQAALLLIGFANICLGQEGVPSPSKDWKMKPTRIQTRWAKDVSPTNALKEYPRPQMTRKDWKNLNGLWEYVITKKDSSIPAQFEGSILVPYPIESALSGVQQQLLPDQSLWYRKIFHNPQLTNERLLLHFGAVDWQATVFINEKEVGQHTGGYQSFSFDVTDYLKDGDNELLVKVNDPTNQGIGPHGKQVLHPGNIYYTSSSGIWQTVWLEQVPSTYISGIKTTSDIDRGELHLDVALEGGLNGQASSDYSIRVYVNNELKGKGNYNTIPLSNQLTIPVNKARLWSPDDPYLYDLKIQLYKDGKVIDEVKSYFGMRKIEIKKDQSGIDRIFLNNKYTYNLGVLDQGFWPDGLYTAPTDEALAFDISAIKTIGFNTIRKHIKIEPARWYYHADRIGVLVWQDFVNPNHGLPAGAKEEFEKETKATMEQLYNHPSIVMWVLFNERWGAYDQKRLTEWVKKSDPTRLVNGHSGELLYVDKELREPSESPWISSDIVDVHSYPYPMEIPIQNGKARVLGEFGGVGVSVAGHQWDDLQGWGYVQVMPSALEEKYELMTKQLKQLEVSGLSGSIYTQPFDVEGEENGLLTYDREIIKIPVAELTRINQSLLGRKGFKVGNPKFIVAKNIDPGDSDDNYSSFLRKYEDGRRDSIFLRRLTLMALRKKDQSNATRVGNEFIDHMVDVYTKDNLTFTHNVTRTSRDRGFELFRTQSTKVNMVLGKYMAEGKVMDIIDKEELPHDSLWRYANIDWDAIEKKVIDKYGALGEERVWGQRMVYYWEIQDWKNFGKYYALYFERAGYHSRYNINNLSWSVFEHVNDIDVLKVAVKWSKINVEMFDNTSNALDTYANLLHKIGKTQEAIEYQEKAVKWDPTSPEKNEALAKMKRGEPTWK